MCARNSHRSASSLRANGMPSGQRYFTAISASPTARRAARLGSPSTIRAPARRRTRCGRRPPSRPARMPCFRCTFSDTQRQVSTRAPDQFPRRLQALEELRSPSAPGNSRRTASRYAACNSRQAGLPAAQAAAQLGPGSGPEQGPSPCCAIELAVSGADLALARSDHFAPAM